MIRTLFCLLLALPLIAGDEEPTKKNWTNKTELSAIQTDGNSKSSSFGFDNEYKYAWGKNTFTWDLEATRVETTKIIITATAPADVPIFDKDEESTTASEDYFNAFQYSRKITEKASWFAKTTWNRNEPKGISNYYTFGAGLSHNLIKKDSFKFDANYGVDYVNEELLNDTDEDYMAAKLGYNLVKSFKNGSFTQKLNGTLNQERSEDWVVALDNNLAVNINKVLALSLSLNFDYQNDPNYIDVSIPGTDLVFPYQLEELDTELKTSLVINF